MDVRQEMRDYMAYGIEGAPDYGKEQMTDRENIEALVEEMGLTHKEAYFFLIDAGEWNDDETADDLFPVEFLEKYPA